MATHLVYQLRKRKKYFPRRRGKPNEEERPDEEERNIHACVFTTVKVFVCFVEQSVYEQKPQ